MKTILTEINYFNIWNMCIQGVSEERDICGAASVYVCTFSVPV